MEHKISESHVSGVGIKAKVTLVCMEHDIRAAHAHIV